jgi:hypothetical protein
VAAGPEKKRSKRPERFGRGAVEGVAAPEMANNAAATSSFIPLLTLGIPANATMAVIFGAPPIHGVTPGLQVVSEDPRLFWGVINSMYIGNVLLLIMSIPPLARVIIERKPRCRGPRDLRWDGAQHEAPCQEGTSVRRQTCVSRPELQSSNLVVLCTQHVTTRTLKFCLRVRS